MQVFDSFLVIFGNFSNYSHHRNEIPNETYFETFLRFLPPTTLFKAMPIQSKVLACEYTFYYLAIK